MKYSQERKQAVLAKLAPPHQRLVKDVAAEEGIFPATLYHWRQQARLTGGLFPDDSADSCERKFRGFASFHRTRVKRTLTRHQTATQYGNDMDWRDYQNNAAELFREMGFDTDVEEILEGARARQRTGFLPRSVPKRFGWFWITPATIHCGGRRFPRSRPRSAALRRRSASGLRRRQCRRLLRQRARRDNQWPL